MSIVCSIILLRTYSVFIISAASLNNIMIDSFLLTIIMWLGGGRHHQTGAVCTSFLCTVFVPLIYILLVILYWIYSHSGVLLEAGVCMRVPFNRVKIAEAEMASDPNEMIDFVGVS